MAAYRDQVMSMHATLHHKENKSSQHITFIVNGNEGRSIETSEMCNDIQKALNILN